ncbi:hypothetical protein [Streptomyces sp. NPDC049915]|uniref:hypothetical protein n=1 Tax=Streptomyces sp. NPDC049915 TaxID=3155510 RepID=UPI003430A163
MVPPDVALSEAEAEAEAARLIAESYSTNAPVATSYKDVTPVPVLMLAGAGSVSMPLSSLAAS